MSSGSEAAALVALLRAAKRPLREYAELLEQGGSAAQLLEAEQGLLAPVLLEGAASDVAAWRQEGIRPVTLLDPKYPPNLRAVHDRPPLLFVAGELEPRDARSVAVIGTRKPSTEGIRVARAVAEALVADGFTVVSGLAAGIDTVAHTTALERGGRTVAVIGTGLGHAYPAENAQLQRRIAQTGVVISQFWPEQGPDRGNFPRRNAVMSGIALANVVIEATHTSGSRTQARLALAHGRPVFLMAQLLEQQWAREVAARPGAHVVRSAEEVPSIVERLASTNCLVP